jgi:hypothetical protein
MIRGDPPAWKLNTELISCRYSRTRHAAQNTTRENTTHQLKHICASKGHIYLTT